MEGNEVVYINKLKTKGQKRSILSHDWYFLMTVDIEESDLYLKI